MPEHESIYQSLEDAWAHCLGETMPTVQDINRDPMVCLKAMYFAGASAAMSIAYHHGFTGMRAEMAAWMGEDIDDA